MAIRKPRKSAKKKPTRRATSARAASGRRKAAAKRPKPPRATRKAAPRRAAKPVSRVGLITHTELASNDPAATQAWCQKVLGWRFEPPMPLPEGTYRMWRFANNTGGGIRANNPPEVPGSIPYCEVASIRLTYDAALAAGAKEMLPPMALPSNMGWVAIVAAPGGVPIGFWAMN